jgi:homoserine O-acetyltransferase
MPIASQPVAATGRNYLWRLMIIDAIRRDPEWKNGDYASQPGGFLRILPLFNLMTGSARSLEATGKTHADVRTTLDGIEAKALKTYDANDYLYWYQAIDDYDPEAALPKIRAKVLAVNFADDLLNPVELGRIEQLMPRVRDGAYVIVPAGPGTAGHQTLAQGKVWAPYLQRLLDSLN